MVEQGHKTISIKNILKNLPQPEENPEPCLVALTGPEQGSIFPLKRGTQVLGRDPDCDLVLPVRGVSRRHLEIKVGADGAVELTDLDSTNGLFVNSLPLKQGPLELGDTLALSSEVLLRLDRPRPEVRRFYEELRRSATLDSLTGVLNRRAFLSRLDEECAAAERHNYACCLAILDVDHFKSINDAHGHLVGDQVLLELSRRLEGTARSEDMVGRYGGEEFVLFMRYAEREGGRLVAERVLRCLRHQPITTGAGELQVTASIGVALLDPRDLTATLAAADAALYRAKNLGRDRVELSI